MASLSRRFLLHPRRRASRGGLRLFPLRLGPAISLLAWAAALAHSPAASAQEPVWSPRPGIVGQDDRKPVDTTAWPWQALGRINRDDGSHCTGALIATDAVLTAAHCLMDRRSGGWLPPKTVVFVAGFRRNEDLGYAHGREIAHPAHAIDPRKPMLQDIGDDWAVLYLDHRLAVRPIPVRPLPAGDGKRPAAHLMLAGYSQERPYMLSLHDGCAVQARVDGNRVLFTDCDSTHGDSGSPLLAKRGGKIWIVGVASAIVVRGARVGSYAVSAAAFAGQTARIK